MTFSDFFFDDDYRKIGNISTWNGFPVLQRHSVAEHSHFVTVFTRLICEDVGFSAIYTNKCCTHAMFHDYDEVFTGDVTHNFKHNGLNGDKIRKKIDEYVFESSQEKLVSGQRVGNLIHNIVTKQFISVRISKVVKLADWYAMLFFLLTEYRLGNLNVISRVQYVLASIEEHLDGFLPDFSEKQVGILELNLREIKQQIMDLDERD